MEHMVRFELKKVVSKMSSKVALLLLLVFTIYMLSNANYLVWIEEDTQTELTGKAAAQKLREAEQEWAGPLTEEKLAEVISQGWSQGNRGIRFLLAMAFGEIYKPDFMIVGTLSEEDAGSFYENRTKSLREWLAAQGSWYTEEEKDFLTAQYEAVETPLVYDYTEGWTKLASTLPNVQMLLVLVIGFLVAGIFSEEYRTGASAVFFSAALGRDKAVRAKLKAGLLLITVVYWLTIAGFTAGVLLELGVGGAGCRIQTSIQGWTSFYNITFLQEYMLIAVGGYIGCLFMDSLAMLVSAKTKSTVVAVIVPFAVLFAPAVIKVMESPLAEKVEGLMPYQLVQMNSVIREFYIYKIPGRIVGAAGILLVVYLVLANIT